MMTLLHDALHAAHRPPPRAATATRRVLVAGGAGALGAAVLEELLASRRFAQVAVLVTQPLNVALRGLATVPHEALHGPAADVPEDLAIVVFDRERHANGREDAFLRPGPAALPALASRLHARGVRDLVVVMPHAPATLPDALKRGLASLDEHAVAALGFEHLLIVRSAHAPPRVRASSAPQRVADWVLSQLHLMIPQREKPVRAAKVAQLVVRLAVQLPHVAGGTRVVPPEVVWEAAQAPDAERYVAEWLA
jgi:hypothetical protein